MFFQVTGNTCTCKSSICKIQIEKLYYSNDGPSDELTLTLNQGSSTTTLLGTVKTREAYGKGTLWNDFLGIGPIGGSISIKEGLYNLVIKATKADEYGAEVDHLSLQIKGCNYNTTYVSVVRSGYIQNQKCEPSKECEECEECKNYGIGLIVIGACSVFVSIIVPIVLKYCCTKCCKCCNQGEEGGSSSSTESRSSSSTYESI